MNLNNSEIIKNSVDIRDVCELYGAAFNTMGRGCCPFHDDKHPSASVKNGRFHCYVCNLHLDIFDFVMKVTGCSFQDAISALNSAFSLGLDVHGKFNHEDYKRATEARERKQRALEAFRAEYKAKNDLFAKLQRMEKPNNADDFGEYAAALGKMAELEQWLSDNPWR